MKKLLNVLYVQTQGIYLHREGETVVAEMAGKAIMRLPIHTLSGIVCFGNVLCSPFLLGLCGERGVHVSFLSQHGRFLARVEGGVSGNVLLRVAQFKASQDESLAIEIARSSIVGKILNSRSILMRRQRDHGATAECDFAIARMANVLLRVRHASSLEVLRGLEGEAANQYFDVFNQLILPDSSYFSIQNRNRRPPRDPMNSLLSFLYTMLAHDCVGALESVGLDPQIGFLHALRPGRPSLALDLMEEFRAPLADRVALSLVNMGQVSTRGFIIRESGAVEMSEETRKAVLTAWQKKKKEMIVHPYLGEKIEIGLLPFVQALLLGRHLRGDVDGYPPFLLK